MSLPSSSVAFVGVLALANAGGPYVTTCHTDEECGSTCGETSSDSVAFNEGGFGTKCYCQDGSDDNLDWVCDTGLGYDAWLCKDKQPPNCDTPCGQTICIGMNGLYTNTVVRSACPQHHPVNVQQCCDNQGNADYCTCLVQYTADLNAAPYAELGGNNGWADGAWWGECGSELAGLQISVDSLRAEELVQPFLRRGSWCAQNATLRAQAALTGEECSARDEADCNAGCVWCKASEVAGVRSKCYAEREASVLTHVLGVELGKEHFSCAHEISV